MKFSDDGTPIYLQIVKRIKAEIMSGTLAAGDRLPSVREAAEAYRVNPNTMQRVMTELERDKVIRSSRGVGFFVTDDPGLVAHLKHDEAAAAVTRLVADLTALGLTHPEIGRLVTDSLEGTAP